MTEGKLKEINFKYYIIYYSNNLFKINNLKEYIRSKKNLIRIKIKKPLHIIFVKRRLKIMTDENI